jgi:hypothetical protein
VQSSLDTAVTLAEELELRVATLGDDYRLLAQRALTTSLFYRGDFRRAREHAQAGVKLDETAPGDSELGDFLRGEAAAAVWGYGALAVWLLGEYDQARRECAHAVALARRYDHPTTVTLALFLDGWLRQLDGHFGHCVDYELVMKQAEELRTVSDNNGLVLWSAHATSLHGWARYYTGLRQEGLGEMEAGITAWGETGAWLTTPFWKHCLAEMYAGSAPAKALQYVRDGLTLARQRGERMWEAELLRLEGDLLRAGGDPVQSDKSYQAAINRAREQQSPPLIERAEQSRRAAPAVPAAPVTAGGGAAAPAPVFRSGPEPAPAAEPAGLRDVSEYQFVAGSRRLVIRQAHTAAGADLPALAREYAERCKMFLDAEPVAVDEPSRTARGAEVVRVSAALPEGSLRVALLRFGDGPVVEFALTTTAEDADPAAAELDAVVRSARPAAAPPEAAVARAIAAGDRGSVAYPAGPLLVDVPPAYTAPVVFALATADGRQQYTLERAAAAAAGPVRGPTIIPLLSRGVSTATDADGRPVRYEPADPPDDQAAHRGAAGAAPAADTGEVRGTAVRVYARGPAASPEAVRRLLAALNAAR